MYVFFAVAPCSFTLNGKSYNLRAGDTISVGKAEADRMRSAGFQYGSHLRLISSPPKKVEEPVQESKPAEPAVVDEKVDSNKYTRKKKTVEVTPEVETTVDKTLT